MLSPSTLLGTVALTLLATQAGGQTHRPQLSSSEVQKLETALGSNPNDRAGRSALLDYYFLAQLDPAVAIPARRRHILWLIENTPEDQLAGSPAATIDAAGHALADPRGFKLASEAWRAQVAKPGVKAAALVNAAYFFKTDDKAYTISLLERALTLEPASKEIAARLGDEYALAIMGVTMVNKNGYPMRSDPALVESALAKQAREILTTSQNPYLVAKAGYMLLWQGAVLYYSRKLPFDPDPLAKNALDRAVRLAPGDPEVAKYREQYDAMQREKQRVSARLPAAALRATHSVGSPARIPAPPAVQAASAPAPTREMSVDDLKTVTAGMSRETLLKLGSPAGRITTDDDGHLVEIYQYFANGTRIGTVRLRDGTVSTVNMP